MLWPLAAHAQLGDEITGYVPRPAQFDPTPMPSEAVFSEDKPVALTADQIDYHQQDDVVIASGKVEVVQGETILVADSITYDRTKNVVMAKGNVSVMDETGSVMFADEAELRDDMREGVIREFKARLIDDSTFAANSAVKVNDDVLELNQAVYSPCKVKCAEEGQEVSDPLWQMRADHVKIDNVEQSVTYRDATMEVYGVPVFYTPYFSHATPNADGKSGVMVPEFQRDDNLGNVYRVPLYWAIAPDRDLVFTPTYTSKEGIVGRAEYKQKFDQGNLDLDGSLTRPRERDPLGNVIPGHEWRGHMYARGDFDVDDETRWGFDVRRTSDDTYLRKYDIDDNTLLVSRLYGEKYDFVGSNDRNSLTAEAIGFQGLAITDDSRRIPLIAPLVTFDYESDPLSYGARYFMNSNAMMLTRDVGAKSRRLSNTIGMRLPTITDGGQVIEFATQVRGDIYDVDDVTIAPGRQFDGTTGRVVPEASVLWRYPLINQISQTSVMVEPVVNAVISPNGGNPVEIPNEDSLVPEFTDTNLFSNNRFAGYDRVEQGPRVSYGLRGLVNYKAANIDWLFGQHYRAEADKNFPFSNDLDDHLSDYVGKVGVQLNPLYFAYRFRMDKENLAHRRKEFDLRYSDKRFTLMTSYLSLQNDPVFASREEIVGTGRVELSKNWAVGAGARRDLEIGQLTSMGGEIVYKNECVDISNVLSREYTRDRELKPNTSYMLRVTLKNLN